VDPWHIANIPLLLRQWQPKFKLKKWDKIKIPILENCGEFLRSTLKKKD
jgi:hypothetical protein